MTRLFQDHKLIEYKKSDKPSDDQIDLLINKIINQNDLHENIIKNTSSNIFSTWIMPEESKGFIKFKKHDPL